MSSVIVFYRLLFIIIKISYDWLALLSLVLLERTPQQALQCGDFQERYLDVGLWLGHEQREPLSPAASCSVTPPRQPQHLGSTGCRLTAGRGKIFVVFL